MERHRTKPPDCSDGVPDGKMVWLSSGSLTLFTGVWSPYLTDANKHPNMCAVGVDNRHHTLKEHRKGKDARELS